MSPGLMLDPIKSEKDERRDLMWLTQIDSDGSRDWRKDSRIVQVTFLGGADKD